MAQKPGSYKNIQLDGVDDYVLIQDDTSLNPKYEITVEAWIRADSFGKNIWDNSVFCKHGWGSGNQGYVLRVGGGGGVSFIVADTNGKWVEANSSGNQIYKGEWYHIAGTFDGDSVNAYVNGELVASTLYTGRIEISSGLNPRIGQLAYGGGRIFQGEIDEVRVWSKAMSDSMLRKYMCQKITKAHPNYKSLVGYWKMDEGKGTTIADASPYGNDGSLRNGITFGSSLVPLGDTSVVMSGKATLSLVSSQNDVLTINSDFSSPGWTHFYLINDTTENPAEKNLNVRLDSTHYFGLYTTDAKATYTITLDYDNHKVNGTTDECGVDLLVKQTGGGGSWAGKSAGFFANGDSLELKQMRSAEFMLGIYPMDSSTALTTETGNPWFCSNDGVWLKAAGNNTFKYRWYMNDTLLPKETFPSMWASKVASYKVDIERSASCKITSNELKLSERKAPSVSLKPFKGVCEDVDSVVLSGGNPLGGRFIFKGLVNDSIILPSKTGAGKYDIVYEITDTNGCWARDTQTFTIWALPRPYLQGSMRFCNNLDTVKLSAAQPAGGTYTGPGIVNNQFIPARLSRVAGRYPFTYGYTDGNGCYNELKDSLTVLQYNKAAIFPIAEQCEKNDPVTVKYYPLGGELSGPGISGSTFDPGVSGTGTFQLIYRYTNNLGCTDMDTQEIVVHKNTPVTWNYALTTCLNKDSIIPDQGNPAGGYFEGKGIVDSMYFMPMMAGVGTHSINYIFVDTNKCKNKATIQAKVNDTTAISTSPLGNICEGSKLTLNHATPAGGTYSGPGVQGGELLSWLADTGNIRVFYEYPSGLCTSVVHINGYIIPKVKPELNFPEALCENVDPVRLTAIPAGGTFSGTGVISNLFAPQFAGEGKHFVQYSYKDSYGCESKTGDTISVVAVPEASALSHYAICANEPAFTPGFGNPAPGYGSYYRLNGDTIDQLNPGNPGAGKYKVYYVLFADAGCKDSALTNFVVNPVPQKPVITRNSNTLRSSVSNGIQWYDLSGPIQGANSRDFSPQGNGDYYVVATSDSGCTNVSDTFQFQMLGVNDINYTGMIISPNPSRGMVEIRGLNNAEKIMVYDMLGQMLLTIEDPSEMKLDLGQFASGRYSIVCLSEGKFYTGIVQVSR